MCVCVYLGYETMHTLDSASIVYTYLLASLRVDNICINDACGGVCTYIEWHGSADKKKYEYVT